MPKGLEWSMLSKDDKERLRGLSKEHAENIGLHILAAYALEESEPDRALAHARWVARQASRVDIARETLALVAYRQGDYKLALREFRTAYRMNGYLDYLPFIADCERGLGEPRKAIEEATSPEGKALRGESKAEMFLVYAGALADLGLMDQAIAIVHQLGRAKGLTGDYRMRALQAEQNFLEQAGQGEQSQALEPVLDKLEAEYADQDDDESEEEIIIDNDLEHATATMLESLNIPLGGDDWRTVEEADQQIFEEGDEPEADAEQEETAQAEAASEEDSEPASLNETEAEAELLPEQQAESEPVSESLSDSDSSPESQSELESQAEPHTESQPEMQPESEPQTDPEPQSQTESQAESETESVALSGSDLLPQAPASSTPEAGSDDHAEQTVVIEPTAASQEPITAPAEGQSGTTSEALADRTHEISPASGEEPEPAV
ncbi:hypothetical protein KIM372_07210 [Bombiscardovia nodaiensis]|uniref:Helicase n=1 Tax=Bombiscardovia nodaiensis TaxID=2932181 RepID=A0ABM8B7T8_9BIFI|nr:hypothetical protein KIM372_07210 [Bombiscardovia nodaiensis]